MSANIRTAQEECVDKCMRYIDGYAEIGDVERCEHGAIYYCWRTWGSGRYSNWRRLSKFWDRRKYWAAVARLVAAGGDGDAR